MKPKIAKVLTVACATICLTGMVHAGSNNFVSVAVPGAAVAVGNHYAAGTVMVPGMTIQAGHMSGGSYHVHPAYRPYYGHPVYRPYYGYPPVYHHIHSAYPMPIPVPVPVVVPSTTTTVIETYSPPVVQERVIIVDDPRSRYATGSSIGDAVLRKSINDLKYQCENTNVKRVCARIDNQEYCVDCR